MYKRVSNRISSRIGASSSYQNGSHRAHPYIRIPKETNVSLAAVDELLDPNFAKACMDEMGLGEIDVDVSFSMFGPGLSDFKGNGFSPPALSHDAHKPGPKFDTEEQDADRSEEDEVESEEETLKAKRNNHKAIERKYRVGINGAIQDIFKTAQAAAKEFPDQGFNLQRQSKAEQLRFANRVLTLATQEVKELREKNAENESENLWLRARLAQFEPES